MEIFKYKIQISKDWNRSINHIICTHLIEKGTNLFCYKSTGSSRFMEIITNKDITIKLNETIVIGRYLDGDLKIKILSKEKDSLFPYSVGDKVKINGQMVLSYMSSKDNKEYSPMEYSSGKILDEEKLNSILYKNMGLEFSKQTIHCMEMEIINNHVRIYNQALVEVEGTIKDLEIFNKLQYSSAGKKKSYGIGWMNIIKME